MNIEIINNMLRFTIHGFSNSAVNKDYKATAFQLSALMWQTV